MKLRFPILILFMIGLGFQIVSNAEGNQTQVLDNGTGVNISLTDLAAKSSFPDDERIGKPNVQDSGGFQLLAANLNNPKKIAGQTHIVVVLGDYAYIGVGTRLVVIDVSRQNKPKVMGETAELSDVVRDVKVYGDNAFVAAGKAGLRIIDISNPKKPVEIGKFYTTGTANGLFVRGGHVYVADGSAGLHVIDISDPTAPVAVGANPTSGWDWDVSVIGNYAYIAGDEAGLRVIDISDPQAPYQLTSYYLPNDALGVYAVDNYVYVAAAGSGLRIIDVSNPSDPLEVVYVSGSYAYLASERAGLGVLDISDPAAPLLVSDFKTQGAANTVRVFDKTAFIADGVGGLSIIKLKDGLKEKQWEVFLPLTAGAAETTSP
jgi:hypothetical protein